MLACAGYQPGTPCNARTDVSRVPDPWLLPIASITGNGTTETVTLTASGGTRGDGVPAPGYVLAGISSVDISGVYDGSQSTAQLKNAAWNTFGAGVAITVTGATTFTFSGTNSGTITNSGFAVVKPVPQVNVPFIDPVTGEREVRVTCANSQNAAGFSGNGYTGSRGCPSGVSAWTSAGHGQHFFNTNSSGNVGHFGLYCPSSGVTAGGVTCTAPGLYRFYVELALVNAGGVIFGVFDPVTMTSCLDTFGGTAIASVPNDSCTGGTYSSASTAFSGSAQWSHSNPDVVYFPSRTSIMSENVATGVTTTVFDTTGCGLQPAIQTGTTGGQQMFLSGINQDRYFAWNLGGVNVGTANEADVQNLWNFMVVYDSLASPHPLCYWYNTITGQEATFDTVSLSYTQGPAQVVDNYQGNAPSGQTQPPPAVSAASITQSTTGSLAAGNYCVKLTFGVKISGLVGAQVETTPSGETCFTLTTGNHSFTIPSPAALASTAVDQVVPSGYNVYLSTSTGTETCQTCLIYGPTPTVTVCTGTNTPVAGCTAGTLAAGAYAVRLSYTVNEGLGNKESNGTNGDVVSPPCVTAAANNALLINEPTQLTGIEQNWNIYLSSASACSSLTASSGPTYHLQSSPAAGSGAQVLTSYNSAGATTLLGILTNATGLVPIGTNWTTPTEASLYSGASVPSANNAGFGQHAAAMMPSGLVALVSTDDKASSSAGNQTFMGWWNVGTTTVALCGQIYSGPDGNNSSVCGGHPTYGYNVWAENRNASSETATMYKRTYTNLNSNVQLNNPPPPTPLATEDVHQGWEFNPGNDATAFCYDAENTKGDDSSGSSGWALKLRRAFDNEFVCVSTDGSGTVYRLARTHGSSYGSILGSANWVSQNSAWGIAVLPSCKESQDGKFAMCAVDWYGTIPTLNGLAPSTTNAPGVDDFIYELK